MTPKRNICNNLAALSIGFEDLGISLLMILIVIGYVFYSLGVIAYYNNGIFGRNFYLDSV